MVTFCRTCALVWLVVWAWLHLAIWAWTELCSNRWVVRLATFWTKIYFSFFSLSGPWNRPRHRRQGFGQSNSFAVVIRNDVATLEAQFSCWQNWSCMLLRYPRGQISDRRFGWQGQVFRIHKRNLFQNRLSACASRGRKEAATDFQ